MKPIQLILIICATIIFLIILYKIIYIPGDTTMTVPSWDQIKSNVQSSVTMCDVSTLGTVVDFNGDPIESSNIRCSSCTNYLSLAPSGSCKYIDDDCKLAGDQIPCPFS